MLYPVELQVRRSGCDPFAEEAHQSEKAVNNSDSIASSAADKSCQSSVETSFVRTLTIAAARLIDGQHQGIGRPA
jgi:hypothetical protein